MGNMTNPIPSRETSRYSGHYARSIDSGRLIAIFRDSVRIAMESKRPDTARARFELAVELYHQLVSMRLPSNAEPTLHLSMQALADEFLARSI